MTTATSSEADREVLPGYYVEHDTGAWLTFRWPADPLELPPSLAPALIAELQFNLRHHLTGGDWSFTPSQSRFLWMWYALRPFDENRPDVGQWLYRSGVKRGAKGTGKDPLAAAMCHGELWGPAKFADWDGTPPAYLVEAGWRGPWPRGEEYGLPLVQIAANSEAQGTDVLRVANALMKPELAEELGWDPGILRSQIGNGGRIEILTFSEKSSEGDPATAIFLNESHHMTHSSGGQRLAAVARRNVAKSPAGSARLCEFTNAHLPGEGSVAEDSFNAWQAQVGGQTRRQDILYDSREAPPDLSLHEEDELERGIAAAYADSPWTDVERIRDEAQDPRTTATDSVRFYFNALPTNEMAWIDPRKFDALARSDMIVADQEPLALFLDCSKSHDATTLVGCRISDGHVLALGGWQRPHGDRGIGWLAPKSEVDSKVREVFDRWDVQWFGVDPSPARDDETEALYWGPLIDEWHRDLRDRVLLWATPGEKIGHAVLFDMRLSTPGARERNRLFTECAEQTAADIDEQGTLSWDGDSMMRVHVHNARRRTNQWGVSLGKLTRDSNRLVDYAVSMVGARLGRRIVLNSGKTRKKKRSGVVRGMS